MPNTNIQAMRKKANLTQIELAEKLNVGQSTVAMWESGKNFPGSDKLPDIAAALGCTIDDLFGKGEPHEKTA